MCSLEILCIFSSSVQILMQSLTDNINRLKKGNAYTFGARIIHRSQEFYFQMIPQSPLLIHMHKLSNTSVKQITFIGTEDLSNAMQVSDFPPGM